MFREALLCNTQHHGYCNRINISLTSLVRRPASLVGDDIDSQPGPSVGPAWVDNVAELVTDVSVSIPLNFQTWHRSSSSLYIVVELVILADLAR